MMAAGTFIALDNCHLTRLDSTEPHPSNEKQRISDITINFKILTKSRIPDYTAALTEW